MFKVEVIADDSGKWCGNAMTYDTVDLAREAAISLHSRWMLVRTWRVVRVADGEVMASPGFEKVYV